MRWTLYSCVHVHFSNLSRARVEKNYCHAHCLFGHSDRLYYDRYTRRLRGTVESDVLAGLAEEQRRVVKTAVADNVLEGWDPTPADLGLLADNAVGKITAVQYRAAVIAAASA
jgi:hypothetical protein